MLFIDAFAGMAGDMFLGALVDLGVSDKLFAELPGRLNLPQASIRFEVVHRCGIAAHQAHVEFPHEHAHRHLSHIEKILRGSDLPGLVIDAAIATFNRLAEAEARVHGTTLEKVHFHEVGAIDAILDITGTHLGVHELGVTRIACSPIPLSRGMARMDHGVLPLPAPATVLLLEGIPTRSIDLPHESVTPTGAALAASLASEFCLWPEIIPEATGWGAGTKEGGDLPNLLRLILGTACSGSTRDRVWVLECEIDDMNPEFLEPLWEEAFQIGALDLYLTPVQMKKGRQGTLLTLLAPEQRRTECEKLLLEKTSTFGVRRYACERTILERETHVVETVYGQIPVKVAVSVPGKAAPEAAAVRKAAQQAAVPMMEVYLAAVSAWRSRST
jgi:uncharacterized protein (TIGR00299 family) protein